MNQDAAKALFEALDRAATARLEAIDLLSDDEQRQRWLYWEARKAGVPFPVAYDPTIGEVLDRMLALGILNFQALRAVFDGNGRDLAGLMAAARIAVRKAELEQRARRTPGNRHERRAARSRRRGR